MGTNTKNTKNKFDYHQVLFSWFSPNFPIGSFNFSHGLEAAVEMKFIHDSFTLENWISNLITDGSVKPMLSYCLMLTEAKILMS